MPSLRVGDPDLVIRTGGERRISNFLLYGLAYAELHFADVLWPDFAEADLYEAIASYQRRERRFGLVGKPAVPGRTARRRPCSPRRLVGWSSPQRRTNGRDRASSPKVTSSDANARVRSSVGARACASRTT